MDIFKSMDITASALTAERLRQDVIAENLSNMNTTRTANGDPYRRKYTVVQSREATFDSFYTDALRQSVGNGVRVVSIEEDMTDFKLDYNPEHPDADEDGYVRLPNVDTLREMVDIMTSQRAYDANITIINATKAMANKALEIGR